MTHKNGALHCDMTTDCAATVTHIDEKGFVYCRAHGICRKNYCRCRQLTKAELRTLMAGKTIHYRPEMNRVQHDQRAEDEQNYNQMIGESLARY